MCVLPPLYDQPISDQIAHATQSLELNASIVSVAILPFNREFARSLSIDLFFCVSILVQLSPSSVHSLFFFLSLSLSSELVGG